MSDQGEPTGSVLPVSGPGWRSRWRLLLGAGIAVLVVIVVLSVIFWPRHPADTSATPVVQTSGATPAPPATSAPGQVSAGSSRTPAKGTPPPPATPPPGTPPAGSGTLTSAPGRTGGSVSLPPHVSSVSMLGADLAAGIVQGAGITVPGVAQQAVQWQDANGRNILLATRRVDHNKADSGADAGTVTVLLVSHLGGRAKVLTTLTDSGGTSPFAPCRTDFAFGVLPGSLTVRDDDSDGVGEATAAWFLVCHGDVGLYPVRLALLSGPGTYVLRGEALPKVGPDAISASQRKKMQLPAGTFTADPGRGRWPVNSYSRAAGLFHQLFS